MLGKEWRLIEFPWRCSVCFAPCVPPESGRRVCECTEDGGVELLRAFTEKDDLKMERSRTFLRVKKAYGS